MKMLLYPVLSLVLLGAGCNRAPSVEAAGNPAATPAARFADEIPSGTVVHVRLLETLDTKRNRAGDRFTATLDEPLFSGDRVIVPKGTEFKGHIVQARESGRFKGIAPATEAHYWSSATGRS
jgi:hypothetical protein